MFKRLMIATIASIGALAVSFASADKAKASWTASGLLGLVGETTADWTFIGGNDSLWSGAGSATFEVKLAAFNNSMGFADAAGNNKTFILNKDSIGAQVFVPSFDPFTFYLDTPGYVGDTWYSKKSLNSDGGLDHLLTFRNKADPLEFLLFWEDLPLTGPDQDFNDFVVRVNLTSGGPQNVPEPASLGLIGLGLLGLGLARRRRNS